MPETASAGDRPPTCPGGLGLDGHLRVRSAVSIVRSMPGWETSVADPLLQAFDLPAGRLCSQLSQGQRTRLGLVLSLGRRARTDLLDDPFLGLDPMAQVVAEWVIAERAAESTMVIASQHAPASERLCDHLLFLRRGTLVWCAPTESWRERHRRVRVRGRLAAVDQLALVVLHAESRGESLDVLLDDPAGTAEQRLRIAGARVDALPLPLDELLMMVAA